MVDVTIRVIRGRHCCGWTTNGLDWQPNGCEHETPRAACDHVGELTRDELVVPDPVDRTPVDWSEETL